MTLRTFLDSRDNAIHEFDKWMKQEIHPQQSDVEHLLKWFDNIYISNDKSYKHFLELLQLAAEVGYKTAIDIPPSAEDFRYRKLVRQFDQWMKDNKHPAKNDIDFLLEWLNRYSIAKEIKNYEDFVGLTLALAKKGYHTTIDIFPSREKVASILKGPQKTPFGNLEFEYLLKKPEKPKVSYSCNSPFLFLQAPQSKLYQEIEKTLSSYLETFENFTANEQNEYKPKGP